MPTTTATGPVASARTSCIQGLKTRPRSHKSWTRCRGLVSTNNNGTSLTSVNYADTRRDTASGNYQLGARTYNPSSASFLTPDTYPQSNTAADAGIGADPLTRNTYTYVNGDPVNAVDPSGHRQLACDMDLGGRVQSICGNLSHVANIHSEVVTDSGSSFWDSVKSTATFAVEAPAYVGYKLFGEPAIHCVHGSASGCVTTALNVAPEGLGRLARAGVGRLADIIGPAAAKAVRSSLDSLSGLLKIGGNADVRAGFREAKPGWGPGTPRVDQPADPIRPSSATSPTEATASAAENGSDLIRARDVRFTQDSVGASFRKTGQDIVEAGEDWATAGRAPEWMNDNPIRIFTENGKTYSLDNRRLLAGQYADVSLPYRWATPEEIALRERTELFGGTGTMVRYPGAYRGDTTNWAWWEK